MSTNPLHQEIAAQPRDTSRRDWLRHAGFVAGAFALAGSADRAFATMQDSNATPATYPSIVPESANPNRPIDTIPAAAKAAKPGDVDILNFALGLEYLEADFYARVVQAHQTRPYLKARAFEAAQKLALDEAAHVAAILDILGRAGATPIAKPQFQFPNNVFSGQLAFLDLATTFEETGTGAYLGAAPKVKSTAALKFAASIYGIETRHAGLIRSLNGTLFSPSAFEQPLTVDEVTKRVTPFIIG
jgi:hypothetical protein